MKVILVAASSLNGKITKGDDPNIYSWTSEEDTKLFFSLIKKHNLIVMGARTYETARNIIKLKANKLRIVLTRNPKKYRSDIIKGSLEFSSESPKDLIKRLEKQGYKEILLVGGSKVYTLFLKAKLVDELHITIEPYIFGKGKDLILEEELEVRLRLIGVEKLNVNGTLHLRYRVEYSSSESVI